MVSGFIAQHAQVYRLSILCTIALLVGLLAACGTKAEITPTYTLESCDSIPQNANVTCISAPPSGILLQSPVNTQVTIDLSAVTITLTGTLYANTELGYQLTFATLEGVSVIGAAGGTRIVQPGAQVSIPLGGDDGLLIKGAPSTPYPFDENAIRSAPLDALPRAVQLPAPIAAPPGFVAPPTRVGVTPVATTAPNTSPSRTKSAPSTPTIAVSCTPRADWTGTYKIRRGDTLSAIAARYGVTLADLQAGNCITNPNRITSGQALRVPGGTAEPGSTQPAITLTPTSANFRADQGKVQPGSCTTVRWDVDNVSAVYLDNQTTTNHNAQQVCPGKTTVYTLLVVYPNGKQDSYHLTIEVSTSSATFTPVG